MSIEKQHGFFSGINVIAIFFSVIFGMFSLMGLLSLFDRGLTGEVFFIGGIFSFFFILHLVMKFMITSIEKELYNSNPRFYGRWTGFYYFKP